MVVTVRLDDLESWRWIGESTMAEFIRVCFEGGVLQRLFHLRVAALEGYGFHSHLGEPAYLYPA